MTPFGRQPVTAGLLAAQALSESASPCPDVDKWQVLRDLTVARAGYGVSDRDLAVLSALVSFHPRQKLQDNEALIVFPSNASLAERAHGMAESTLRRHLAALVRTGLIIRRDSPNGKRFSRKSPVGHRIAYGFDLRPLLIMAVEISAAAETARADALRLRLMREEIVIRLRDIRKLLEWQEAQGSDCERALGICAELNNALRRKASVMLLENIRGRLAELDVYLTAADTKEMTANDSQNERHCQSSNTYLKESEECSEQEVTLQSVLEAAPEVHNYARDRITDWRDLIAVAWFIHPMMGITEETWRRACEDMGEVNAAVTIVCMLQRAGSIKKPGGYLRKLSQKAGAGSYTPIPMVMALLRSDPLGNPHAKLGRC